MKWFISIICLLITACATQQMSKKEKPKELKKEKIELKEAYIQKDEKINKKKIKQKLPQEPGSPMGQAVNSIEKAKKDMVDTVKLISQLNTGDRILDCKNNRKQSLQTLQTFFGNKYLKIDKYTFWFTTLHGKKIGVYPKDGILHMCKIGMFSSFKRLITIQQSGNNKTETEFYVDTTKKELMVHRYRSEGKTHENYRLADF